MNDNDVPAASHPGAASAAADAAVSRRSLLRWSLGAAAAVTAGPLLAACGSDDDTSTNGNVTLKVVESMTCGTGRFSMDADGRR